MPEFDDKKEGVVKALTRHLLKQANLYREDAELEKHPQYKRFRNQGEVVVKYLGSEDYLSLVSAIDRDDSVTILRLMQKANRNQRKQANGEVVETKKLSTRAAILLERRGFSHFARLPRRGEELLRYLGLTHEYLPSTGGFAVKLSEAQHEHLVRLLDAAFERDRPAIDRFFVNIVPRDGREAKTITVEAADAEDATNRAVKWYKSQSRDTLAEFDVSISDSPKGHNIAILKDSTMKEQKLQESVLGMSRVPGLSRLRELAGLDLPGLEPAELDTIDTVVDEPVADIEAPDVAPRAKKSTESEAFHEAVECLERARSLLDDMRIAEYRLFIGRVDEFTAAVHQMGSELIDEH